MNVHRCTTSPLYQIDDADGEYVTTVTTREEAVAICNRVWEARREVWEIHEECQCEDWS